MTMMTSVIAFEPRASQPLLRRPRLLVQAARAGLAGWNRDRDLKRVLKCENVPKPGAALTRLHGEEARLDTARRENRAEYDLHRHIMVLIAILAETAAAAPQPLPRGMGAVTPFRPRAAICP